MIIPTSDRTGHFLRHVLSWPFLLSALALTWNAADINGPMSDGGPMAIDLSPIGEFFSLILGLALLRWGPFPDRRFPRWGFLAAALVLAVPAMRNFHAYPPIMDGAYFMNRYGRDSELWPADAVFHAIAASGFIGALYGFIRFGSKPLPAHRHGRTITAVAFVACSLGSAFLLDRAADAQVLGRSVGFFLLVLLLTGCLSLFWIKRSRAALVVLLYSAVFFGMIGALPILFEL